MAQAQDNFKAATFDSRGIIWMYYDDIGPVPGRVEIPADKKTQFVLYVAVHPDSLTADGAEK